MQFSQFVLGLSLLGFGLGAPSSPIGSVSFGGSNAPQPRSSRYGDALRSRQSVNITDAEVSQVETSQTITTIVNGTIEQIQITKLIQEFDFSNLTGVIETFETTDVKRTTVAGTLITVEESIQQNKIVDINGVEIVFQENMAQITQLDILGTTSLDAERIASATTLNPDQATVMQIVKVVEDVSAGGSTRYLQRNLIANAGAPTTSTCLMTDAQVLTVGAATCTSAPAKIAALNPTVAASILAAVETDNPTVIKTVKLANSGAPAPTAAAGVTVKDDPAAALLGDSIAGSLTFC